MPRPSWIFPCLFLACLGAGGLRHAVASQDFVFNYENVMGTSLELRVRADDEKAAHWAEEKILGEIDRLGRIFSGYDRESEFSRWQATAPGTPTKVSAELYEMLEASDRWRTASAGAFDPRVQVLTTLWTRCAREGRMPSPGEEAEALAQLEAPAWRLDPAVRTAERLTACPLSLNAIAKGFIVGKASEAALKAERGIRGLVLNVGGDLRARGDVTRLVGIVAPTADSEAGDPFTYVEVRDRSVATSGNSQRGFRIQGAWYSHIFDPRTARPVAGVASATVLAKDAADADALATALNVLTPAEGVRLVESCPDAECLIIAADGAVTRSRGWGRFEKSRSAVLALADEKAAPEKKDEPAAKPAAAPWGRENELVVNFEINRPEKAERGYRRPYVAIWVEDKDGFPVRNLVLWVSHGGPGPFQWLPDLRRWHKSDQPRKAIQKTDMVDAISRPTRPPGKYTVIWDGKDDLGKPVPAGEYTLYIDSAREHGTYQNIRTPVKVGGAPFAEELKGNAEIKSAAVEYRKKSRGK